MSDARKPELPLTWQKAQTLSAIFAAVAIPLVVAIVGVAASRAKDKEELALKQITLTLEVLQKTSVKDAPHIRLWAVEIRAHHSPVPMPDLAKTELSMIESQVVQNALEGLLRKPPGVPVTPGLGASSAPGR